MQLFTEPEHGIDGTPIDSERIRTLNELVIDLVGTRFEVVKKERLRSKKNIVYHVILKPKGESEVTFIVKAFVTDQYELELNLLKRCADGNLRVPQIIAARDGVLLLSFIEGELLVDQVNRAFDTAIILQLAKWYYDFHSLQKLLKGDPRLRNFIVADDGLYGIDFEEATEGHWIVDLGGIAGSLLDTNPINDHRKRAMVWLLLDKYLDLKGVQKTKELEEDYTKAISTALRHTAEWRKSDTLMNLAEKIEKNGLIL